MTGTRKRAIAAVIAAGMLVLSGCAGSGGGGGGGGDSEKITFRIVAAEGSGLTNYPDAQAGARAAVDAINAAGGVGGKQIELSFCNTRGEANQAVTCAREAVEDGVDAMVGNVDIFSTQSMPVAEAGGVPIIGNIVTNEMDATNPISYPLHGGNYATFVAGPALFQAAGQKRMSIIQLDFASTAAQAELVETAASDVGMDSAGVILVPASGVTDYSPFVQQVKERGADSALVLLGPAGLQGVYKAAGALGVDAQFAGTVFSFGESEAQAVGESGDGIWVISPFASPADLSVPGIAEYNEQLTASGVGEGDIVLRRAAGLNAWLAVYAAAEVAGEIDGEVTSAAMIAAMEKMGPFDVKGLLTWDPSSLGSAELGRFPRLPASEAHVLTFEDGVMVPFDLPPVDDPLASVR
jgi:ABC-type branched-subunit amino acid transport system substrate-binding protein